MLSIVVNDALLGIDIMKKYPGFYARMLASEELRTAFLDSLELLELSQSEELPELSDGPIFSLDLVHEIMPKPTIKTVSERNLMLIWHRTAQQLQKLFEAAQLQPQEAYRYSNYSFDEKHITIVRGVVKIEEEEMDMRLDLSRKFTEPENLELVLTIFASEEGVKGSEVMISWGSYIQTAEVNHFGLVRLPLLKIDQIFDDADTIIHDLECRLLLTKQA